MRLVDVSGDGRISYSELLLGLRCVDCHCLGADGRPLVVRAGTWEARRREAPREPLLEALDLEDKEVLRKKYLWSRRSNVVYEPVGRATTWPKPLGTLDKNNR